MNVSKFASREVNSSKECNPQDESCARKTIITYAVHPSLLLDNVFLDLPEGSNSEGVDAESELDDLLSRLLELAKP